MGVLYIRRFVYIRQSDLLKFQITLVVVFTVIITVVVVILYE